jgi:hypothetical protein
MIKKPISTCIVESCENCRIREKVSCHFSIAHLLRFYFIILPSFIIAAINMLWYSNVVLYIWVVFTGLFFLIVQIRILCTHCPHYKESSLFLKCWANRWIPKFWKYQPGPMNVNEKSIMIGGFTIIWGFPLVFILMKQDWIMSIFYLVSVFLSFILIRMNHCKKCMNFSCPLNCVENKIKEDFFKNNPSLGEAWKSLK